MREYAMYQRRKIAGRYALIDYGTMRAVPFFFYRFLYDRLGKNIVFDWRLCGPDCETGK